MEQFFKPIKDLKLTPDERDNMRRRIAARTELHPLHVRENAIWPFYVSARMLITLSIVLLAGVGGFITQARPGDVFYSVKTKIVENVGDAFAISEDAQLEWDITKLERMIADEEQLMESIEL